MEEKTSIIDYYEPQLELTLKGCGFLGEFLSFIKVAP